MPAKEIKELRLAGKLEEALEMALMELNNEPDNIWAKRNISWVYYEMIKQNTRPEHFDAFSFNITNVINLGLPETEQMVFENVGWQIIKMGHALLKSEYIDRDKFDSLLSTVKELHLPKPSKIYSAFLQFFHKIYKDTSATYIELIDWWNLENLREEDYQKETFLNSQSRMSLAEQVYINYAKHLLPQQTLQGITIFNKDKVEVFLPKLTQLDEQHPEYQYPAYYIAKLLLALGERDNILSSFLPFAKKKRNDFWVWELLSEVIPQDEQKIFACYCKGLSCYSPEEMLVGLRAKIIPHFLKREMRNEAKTEIVKIVDIRTQKGWKIPPIINGWKSESWFSIAVEKKDNKDIYCQFAPLAEEILYYDIPEEAIIVDFLNADKKIFNFIDIEQKMGFVKYDRFIKTVKIGDTFNVRFLKKENSGSCQIATIKEVDCLDIKKIFVKEFRGNVKMNKSNGFGFVDDVYLATDICNRNKLFNDSSVTGLAIKSFDKKKNQWGWKAFEVKIV